MEIVHLTLLCCRHAVVVIRHEWSRLAPPEARLAWRNALRERARFKAET
jgi:hypothetical protein